ncbi:MAG: DUF4054 domain-containing protein [Shewanella oncorhynchi]
MTALEYFRLFAVEFAGESDPTVLNWIGIASLRGSTECLDDEMAAMAQAYYAAHLMSLNASAASSGGIASSVGAITMEREGDLSRSYGSVKGSDSNPIGRTSYGQQYLEITRPCYGFGILTRLS